MSTRCLRPLVVLLLLGSVGSALSAPGDLDPTFNGTGKVVTSVASGAAQARAVVMQADGKLVAAGEAFNGTDLDFAVVRYDTTGMPDPSFGGTGKVTTGIRTGDDQAHAVIQQSDGKILVAGLSYDAAFNDSTVTLVRYLDDGSLDPGFGGGTGKVTTAISPDFDGALALIQQADGKLVVAGYGSTDLAVVRYALDGSLDMTFNGTGKVTTTIGGGASGLALLQQGSDGKLVVAGSTDDGLGNLTIVLVRYETDGDPDPTFGGGDGIVTTPVGMGSSEARALVEQADGKLVVAGVASNATDKDFALVRYDTAGGPDSMFGTMGIVMTPVGSGDDEAFALVLEPGGELVAGGSSDNGTNLDFALVRYASGGTPDAGFGTAGIVTTPIGTGDDGIASLLLQPNGGLVAAGSSKSGSVLSFALARYLTLVGPTSSTTTTTTTTTTGASTTTTTSTTTLPGSSSTTSTTGSSVTTVPSTTQPASSTTSTTLPAALVPGGPGTKTSSDCYLELRVTGASAAQVQRNQIVTCTDGDPCDRGPCGDDRCDFEIAACTNQTDPALPDCTPPSALASAHTSAKAGLTPILQGAACTASSQLAVSVKRNGKGKYLAGRSKVVLKGSASARKGVSPRKDGDRWTLVCAPRTAPCP